MSEFCVANIHVQQPDSSGIDVLAIYALYDPRYAVYRTSERVTVRFGDDPRLEREQRGAMAPLAPVRGEINGLIDGWRASDTPRYRSAAMRYDRRVADALIVALEGDAKNGLAILKVIRDDIVAERKSRARFLYLVSAGASVVLLALIAAFATSGLIRGVFPSMGTHAANSWIATVAGALGAFFSIARAITGRSIHTDLQMLDNVVDAVLRIMIGAIAALVLQALLDAELFSLQLGNATLGATLPRGAAADAVRITPPLVLLVAGFVAGFSERLVPDLLDSGRFKESDKPQTPAPVAIPESGTPVVPTVADAAAPPAAQPIQADAEPSAEEDVDGCDVDAVATDVPVTPDERLPAAAGGVAGR